MKLSSITLPAVAIGAYAQSVAYSDPATGITFQQHVDPATGYTFGLAAPEDPTTDFIGQLIIPTTGSGYGGISLTGAMTDSLLLIAWPNGKNVVSSIRETSVHSSPTLYAPGTAAPTLITIPPGTFVNSTHLSYTFVCSLCITSNSVAFSPTASTIKLGWSLSNQNVTNPASTTAATFKFHNVGYGSYTLDFADAKSSSYSSWTLLGNATTKITYGRYRRHQ